MNYLSGFIFQDLIITIFFELEISLTNNDLSIFRHMCKFPNLILNKGAIFSLYDFFLLKLIKTIHSMLKCIKFIISFIIYIRLQHFQYLYYVYI